jgi:hypothetical protein
MAACNSSGNCFCPPFKAGSLSCSLENVSPTGGVANFFLMFSVNFS